VLAKIGLLEVVETQTFAAEEVEIFAKRARVGSDGSGGRPNRATSRLSSTILMRPG
jgi:hypothetical protein